MIKEKVNKTTNKIVQLTLLLVLLLLINAQAKVVESQGYFIKLEGDTIRTTFLIPITIFDNNVKIEELCSVVKEKNINGKKNKIYPNEIKEYYFRYNGKSYKMRSAKLKTGIAKYNAFMKVEMEGKLSLLKYAKESFFSKENGEGIQIDNWFFKNKMTNYFSDCPQLVKKIKDYEYIDGDEIKIVRFYNNNCK